MRKRVVVASGVVAFVMAVVLWAPALAAGQAPPGPRSKRLPERHPSAPKRKRGRPGKPSSRERRRKRWRGSTIPAKPVPPNPPKTPWGHPDLRGYYITATYTPLQRPRNVDKPLYTPEEAIGAFANQADTDASADPAVVHYDWKEFGMEAWQSPVRPNMRTGAGCRSGDRDASSADAGGAEATGGCGRTGQDERPPDRRRRSSETCTRAASWGSEPYHSSGAASQGPLKRRRQA